MLRGWTGYAARSSEMGIVLAKAATLRARPIMKVRRSFILKCMDVVRFSCLEVAEEIMEGMLESVG
jgi:hypothetical protein